MRHRPRKSTAALVCLLCATCLAVFISHGTAQSSVTRTAKTDKVDAVKKVHALKRTIAKTRTATWRTEDAIMAPRTPTNYAEKHIKSLGYLEWSAGHWTRKLQDAKQRAGRILNNRGYLPPAQSRVLGHWLAAKLYGWTGDQWSCLDSLWGRSKYGTLESGWFVKADNPNSEAYGIPQALPGSKMGKGWTSSAYVQIKWGLGYIAERYTNPCGALDDRLAKGWY